MPEESHQLRLTPEVCGLLAERLATAIATFKSWQVRIVESNRLRQSCRILERAYRAGAYPRDRERLRRLGHALQDAHDFHYMARCLPRERLEPIARELQQAVKGSMAQVGGDRKAFQHQAQYFVATALAFADVQPIIPKPSDRVNPDFYIQNGSYYYSVEVKRPSAAVAASRALVESVKQVSAPPAHRGLVVMDVSDCMPLAVREVFTNNSLQLVRANFTSDLSKIAAALEDQMWNDERRKYVPGYEQIAALVLYARGFFWDLDNLEYPELIHHCRFASFHDSGKRTLLWHRSRWLRDLLIKGFAAAGYSMTVAIGDSEDMAQVTIPTIQARGAHYG